MTTKTKLVEINQVIIIKKAYTALVEVPEDFTESDIPALNDVFSNPDTGYLEDWDRKLQGALGGAGEYCDSVETNAYVKAQSEGQAHFSVSRANDEEWGDTFEIIPMATLAVHAEAGD